MTTFSIRVRVGTIACAALLAFAAVAPGADSSDLRQRQAAEQRARAMTRELVTSIFDVQLRQLQENGLEGTDLYTDIRTMRQNVDVLVDQEMNQVIELLAQAQEASGEERQAKFDAARQKVREVVVSLMAERQKLRRRLQISRVAAQVNELIDLQTRVHGTTESLPSVPQTERDALTIGAIQDQRDVKALFYELVEVLNEVSGWGGDIGVGAQDGLRILRAAEVEKHLDDADERLQSLDFGGATSSQLAVLRGLEALLAQVEETQGLIQSDRESILNAVLELIRRQNELRTTTGAEPLENQNVDSIVRDQNKIHEDLGELATPLETFPAAPPLLEQAKSSAYAATGELFQLNQEPAMERQSEVIAALELLAQKLESAFDLDRSNLSADELAEILKKLAEAREKVEQATPFQQQALDFLTEDPFASAEAQRQVAEQLEAAAEDSSLPQNVASRLRDAAETAQEAADAMTEAAQRENDLSSADAARRALEAALAAEERAAAELQAALADTERRQLAVKVGELARAAEALERAAAAEHRVAERSIEAAEAGGYSEEQLEPLVTAHGQVTEVAEKVAEGVQHTAPAVTAMLGQTAQPLGQVAEQLAAGQASPGEASIAAAAQASAAAETAAGQLKDAAAVLRSLAGETAGELASVAEAQLQDVSKASRALDALLEEVRESREEPVQLAEALAAVQRAQAAQQRALGREEAARSEELVREIEEAAALQHAADVAAEELAAGRANTPLEAVDREQRAADRLSELAQQAPEGATRQSLEKAAAAAQEAARQTLAGRNAQAKVAREQASQALADAMQQSRVAAEEAAAAPPGDPDMQAQQQVSREAAQAQQTLDGRSPQIGQALERARRASQTAQRQLAQGDEEGASESQQRAAEELAQAGEKLREAMEAAAARDAEQLADSGQRAGDLARQAAQIDPDAANALRNAQQQAQQTSATAPRPPGSPPPGGEPSSTPQSPPTVDSPSSPPPSAAQQQQSRQEVSDDLQRAAASLAAREEQIRRDQGVAEALERLAEAQQRARDQIDDSAEQLRTLAQEQQDPEAEPTQEQREAAQDLNQAMNEFAQTQRAMGEGAKQVSEQEQVANEPLQQGLQTAQQLPQAAQPPPPPPMEGMENQEGEKKDMPPPSSGDGGGDGNSSGMGAGTAPAGQGGGPPQEPPDPNQQPTDGPPGSGHMPPTGLPPSGQPNPNAGSGGSDSGPPQDIGMVPQWPEMTAQQIAGQNAMEQALQAMQDAGESQSQSQSQSQSSSSSSAAGGGGVRQAPQSPNQEFSSAPPGEAQENGVGSLSPHDVDPSAGAAEDDPWFADLPPEVQEAIHAGSQGRAPRGYEERLRRYYQSID